MSLATATVFALHTGSGALPMVLRGTAAWYAALGITLVSALWGAALAFVVCVCWPPGLGVYNPRTGEYDANPVVAWIAIGGLLALLAGVVVTASLGSESSGWWGVGTMAAWIAGVLVVSRLRQRSAAGRIRRSV